MVESRGPTQPPRPVPVPKPPPTTTAATPQGDVPDRQPTVKRQDNRQARPENSLPPDVLVDANRHTVVTGGAEPKTAGATLFLVTPRGERLVQHRDHFDRVAGDGSRHRYEGPARLAGARSDDRTRPDAPVMLSGGYLRTSVSGVPVGVYDADKKLMQPGKDDMFRVMGGGVGAANGTHRIGPDGIVTVAVADRSGRPLRTLITGPDGRVAPTWSEPLQARAVPPRRQDGLTSDGRPGPGTPGQPIRAVPSEVLEALRNAVRPEPRGRRVQETDAGGSRRLKEKATDQAAGPTDGRR